MKTQDGARCDRGGESMDLPQTKDVQRRLLHRPRGTGAHVMNKHSPAIADPTGGGRLTASLPGAFNPDINQRARAHVAAHGSQRGGVCTPQPRHEGCRCGERTHLVFPIVTS